MDNKTKTALELINEIKKADDIIYEVARKKKRSFLWHLWDTLFNTVPSVTDSLFNDKVVYIVAAEEKGTIVEIEGSKIVNTIDIPNWKSEQKTKFKKVVVGEYLYKKFRVL